MTLILNRGSLYVGLGSSAVGAGTVTIPGVVWSGNASETYFGMLATRQLVSRREFESVAATNDVWGVVWLRPDEANDLKGKLPSPPPGVSEGALWVVRWLMLCPTA